MARLVLVEGSSLIYRAFFAIPANITTSAGLRTNATYGFALMFRKILAGKAPAWAAVVFDAPGETFREAEFPAYKAQRPSMPDALRPQLPWSDRLVAAHDWPNLPWEDGTRAHVEAWLADPARHKVFHRCQEAYALALRLGFAVEGVVGDTALASFLVDPTGLIPHRLDQAVKHYLQRTVSPVSDLVGAGKGQRPLDRVEEAAVARGAAHTASEIGAVWPCVRANGRGVPGREPRERRPAAGAGVGRDVVRRRARRRVRLGGARSCRASTRSSTSSCGAAPSPSSSTPIPGSWLPRSRRRRAACTRPSSRRWGPQVA